MLEAHQLAMRRGATRLFTGLSFRVAPGEVLMITGANGTGKTTLLRMLAGLTTPAAGTMTWQGRTLRPFDPALRAIAAFVGHQPALKDELTARENLAALTRLAGEPVTPQALDAALDRVELTRQRNLPARVLSQGQRRRIGLARLSLVRRLVWLLDEPLTALDPAGMGLVAQLIGDHARDGGMAIAATHAALDLPAGPTRTLALT
ncbi:MAG: cytochrome c biogenesis heme-transporting ATPase CcmA [Casimicrobiaceae bacterium]